MSSIKELTNNNFKESVMNGEGIVLVDFYADWCAPCKIMTPSIEELNDEFSGKAKIYKADVEKNSDIVSDLEIKNVPVIVIFKDGNVVSKEAGLRSKDAIKKDLEEACNE